MGYKYPLLVSAYLTGYTVITFACYELFLLDKTRDFVANGEKELQENDKMSGINNPCNILYIRHVLGHLRS